MKAKPSQSALKRLQSLGPEVMDRIDSRLLAGDPAKQIVRWVQSELGQLTAVKEDTLKKALERYREHDLRKRTLERIANAQSGHNLTSVAKRLNAMDQLEEMVRHQRVRVDKLLARESQLPQGILLKDTTNEIRLLKDMLVDLGRVQLETGLLPRASRTLRGQVVGADGEVKHFEWTEEQEELFREIEELEGHAAEEA